MVHSRFFWLTTSSLVAQSICSDSTPYLNLSLCKVTPDDSKWPIASEWEALNSSLTGALIATKPAASSCYPGNPLDSVVACAEATEGWGYSAFHASLPESIDYPIWANNSCLPPNATGYNESLGCHLGGYPQYIVNVTNNDQVSVALKWASQRNIRVVVKGTGHDLNGRSSGPYSLSIWTHHLKQLSINESWPIPGQNSTAHVLIAGSGNNWGEALGFALANDRAVVSGVDSTVGLGGFIQGGGHGPLSSTYGLSADQLLQVTVVTTNGDTVVANDIQNVDLFWALRGGGGGQYGVVTEYVMLTYPAPAGIVTSSITVSAANLSDYANATENSTWVAFASLLSSILDLMDQGVTGSGTAGVGISATRIFGLSEPPPGVMATLGLWAYNSTLEKFGDMMNTTRDGILAILGDNASLVSLTVAEPSVVANYTALFASMNSSPSAAGQVSLSSSRLLGRHQFDNRTVDEVANYLELVMDSQIAGAGSFLTIGLQGGPGPRGVADLRRGALNPVWREAYLHVIATGVNVDLSDKTPGQALQDGAQWAEVHKEGVWREWAPETGAYMNEANPFNGNWQHDFYGESYDRLVKVKRQYDPTYTLSVLSGVDSDIWTYDMNTGKLCQNE